MKKKFILLMTAFTISCTLTLSGCNTKVVEEPNTPNAPNVQEDLKNETNKYSEKDDYVPKKLQNEYPNVKKIVEDGYEDVEIFLDEEAANKRFQGVALVAEGDEIKFAKAYGYADINDNRENTLTTRFAVASITKQFTATAIMQLVDQNKIHLDETIDKYFPKYQYGSKITVRDLLQMRSGIPDYLNDVLTFMKDEEALDILRDYEGSNYYDKYVEDERWSSDVILKSLYKTELLFEPNSAYDYCNTNYYLLGLIIEQVSGMSYQDYVMQRLFKPCNMIKSSMVVEGQDAKGHGSADSGQIVANTDFTYAAGNIYSNIFDLLRWNRMLHTGNIISDESYNEMITPVDGYGYGLFIKDGVIRHSGVIDGFNSNIEYHPATDITIIAMENMDPTTDILDAKYDTSIIHQILMGNEVK